MVTKKTKKRSTIAKPGGISAKRMVFCHEYIVDRCGAQAAIRAGYPKKTAAVVAFHILESPECQLIISALEKKALGKIDVDAEYVLRGAKEMFERCMTKIPVTEMFNGVPEPIGKWKFDSSGAAKALKILGDHVDVNAFKKIDGDGVPIDKNWKVTIIDGREKPIDP